MWREHYTPFGKKLINSSASQNNSVGYTGHQFDKDTDLVYMQARYYDPMIGRFYSNDPVGFRDSHSFNRYAYANNNPYRYTDPTGMCSKENKGSKVVCNVEDKVTDVLEPLMEKLLKEMGATAVAAEERDPNGEYANEAEAGSLSGEVLALGVLVARAKLGGLRKKPGSLGKTKGTDALRKENKQVKDAAKSAGGLTKNQKDKLHQEISGQGYGYHEIVAIAKEIKNGN